MEHCSDLRTGERKKKKHFYHHVIIHSSNQERSFDHHCPDVSESGNTFQEIYTLEAAFLFSYTENDDSKNLKEFSYWVSQKIRSGFPKTGGGKARTESLANPVFWILKGIGIRNTCNAIPSSIPTSSYF